MRRRLLFSPLLAIAFVTAGCDTGAAVYPFMPDLSKLSSYQAQYARMRTWGKDSCNTKASVRQLIQDYFNSAGSIRKMDAAEGLKQWMQDNGYDEPSPSGDSTLGDAVFQGCL